MKFASVLHKLDRKILYVIRAFGRHAFICDGRPRICIHCKRFREFVKGHKMPDWIIVITKKGNGRSLWVKKGFTVRKVRVKIG